MSTAVSATTTVDRSRSSNSSSSSQSNTSIHTSDAVGAGTLSLKRPASPDLDENSTSRKRMRENTPDTGGEHTSGNAPRTIDGHALAADLAQELQCGCCSELVYKPVVVAPCEHFFCGSCCTLWIKNGGTNCPACRGISTIVTPSRALQSMVDVLLRAVPHRQRTERERMQADEIYPTLRAFRIPVPREPSPEPTVPLSTDFVQPCPHCSPNNSFGWTCPRPIPDPGMDSAHAWHINDGTPPGHGFCGNCEVLLALQAPSTTRCDFCQVSFCGINVQGRCVALGLSMQSPHGMSDVSDLIQSAEVYDCFDGNTVEVEFMIDYITIHRLSPRHIYRQIAAHIQSQPNGFQSLIEQDLFADMHTVSGGIDPDHNAPRRFICRLCATEIFLYGLHDWWARERKRAIRDGALEERKDCPEGRTCMNISDNAHAKEFNHVIAASEPEPVLETDVRQSGTSTSTLTGLGPNRHSSSPSPFPTQRSLPAAPANILSDLTDLGIPFPPFAALPLPSSHATHTIPLFMRASAFDGGPNTSAEHASTSATPPIELRPDAPMRTRTAEHLADADMNIDVDEDEHGEPSSSQSQIAVEAHLTSTMLSGYDSEPDSEAEYVQRNKDTGEDLDEDAQLERCLHASAAHAEADLPSVRRGSSQTSLSSKMNIDVNAEHTSAESVVPPVAVSGTFSPFNLPGLSDLDLVMGVGVSSGAPPATHAHSVQVE